MVYWHDKFDSTDEGCWQRSLEDKAKADGSLPLKLVVAAALIDAAGHVLVCQRSPDQHYGNYWEFPGGKIEQDELPERALVRELNEELGIETTSSCLAPFAFTTHVYEEFRVLVSLYLLRQWKGEIVLRVHQDMKWLSPNTLGSVDMLPSCMPMIAMLRDFGL